MCSYVPSDNGTLQIVLNVNRLAAEILLCNEFGLTGAYRFMGLITALWNAGRVQGIREERARRKRKAQTIEQ